MNTDYLAMAYSAMNNIDGLIIETTVPAEVVAHAYATAQVAALIDIAESLREVRASVEGQER